VVGTVGEMSWLTQPASRRGFLVGVALGLVPALTFAVLSGMFLRRSYERASYDEIIAKQLRDGGIYGSAMKNDFYEYKVALYRTTLPKLVAIGSSRTMELQQLGFRAPFVTLGGAVRSISDGERIFAEMKATGHLPEIVIFGVDYWWFNDAFEGYNRKDESLGSYKARAESWLGTYFSPARWLYSRKVGAREYVEIGLHGKQLPRPLPPAYGLAALDNLRGFAPDGHYRYLGDAFGRLPEPDARWKESIDLIRRGGDRFVYGEHPSEKRFAEFHALLDGFRAAGVHVITFMPPVSSAILAEHARQGDKLGYIEETRERLRREFPDHHDFLDATTVGSNDCEFVDAYHGGEITYLRVVRALADDPATKLASYVDRDLLTKVIDAHAGHVLADGEAFAPAFKEVDFLDLGCTK
jgi:hypothetical protein